MVEVAKTHGRSYKCMPLLRLTASVQGVVELIERELHDLDDVRPHLHGRFKLANRLFPLRKQLAL